MKILVAISLFTATAAFAYTSSPAAKHPVRDPAWNSEKREPASYDVKAPKQEKVHGKKSWDAKK